MNIKVPKWKSTKFETKLDEKPKTKNQKKKTTTKLIDGRRFTFSLIKIAFNIGPY